MDPSNLPSQSSSYVRLLHSQQGSVYHENFPYGSFHSSVNFGESDTFRLSVLNNLKTHQSTHQ
uniref:Uncharacterized protein n=1 Tax=Brassica oleracea TaxID=3712 RepID=A0A3P6CTS7_BRAOL|nr:unnamed protein product [Brassica oleracea]